SSRSHLERLDALREELLGYEFIQPGTRVGVVLSERQYPTILLEQALLLAGAWVEILDQKLLSELESSPALLLSYTSNENQDGNGRVKLVSAGTQSSRPAERLDPRGGIATYSSGSTGRP